jgi:single-stranded DNA-binding protein
MNRVFVVGNITGDIYFDRFLIQNRKRSFLRLILMAERPRHLRGMRVVLWDEKAELYFPYLRKGSELAVIGQIESRQHKEKWIHVVVSENLLLLRHINWERGEHVRQQLKLPSPNGTGSDAFAVGEVLKDIHFKWFKVDAEPGSEQYAYLRLRLKSDDYLNGLRVVVRGTLAELAHPYLQIGSKIAVDGHLQTYAPENKRKVVEVTARNMTFLENINWAAGEAAQKPGGDRARQAAEVGLTVQEPRHGEHMHGD